LAARSQARGVASQGSGGDHQSQSAYRRAPPAFTDEECAEIAQGDEELEALWDSPEGQRAQALEYSAADAVDEDRGE